MKKIKNSILFITLSSALLFSIFFPKNIFDVIGKDIHTVPITHLTIHHKDFISHGGHTLESSNISDVERLVTFFKNYKVVRVPIYNYKDYDHKEIYSITFTTDTNSLIRISTSDDGHVFLTNKYGSYGLYKFANKKLDIPYLNQFYNSLLILNI
ncbi:hypothetical protein [Alkaliphilus oremlandii]|uniref:Uncharacterized protein n=1 Tax=Alkaliphilus oremlandii (strain OhILAs) TaxID=350688 RepID=A8MFS8_ALKOO|nr:hypothetical protein [Alkaliphilus oremlandii]ABW17717.1 hypothetical protein Clos_0150 [Alkaliphilus oremlandii OhILAs]